MKKITMAAAFCAVFILACGCGKQEVSGIGDDISEEESAGKPEGEEGTDTPDEDSFAVYQRFLDGEEPVYFREADDFTGEESSVSVEIDTPYTFREICNIINTVKNGNIPLDEFGGHISYACIDCGADGNVELAVKFYGLEDLISDEVTLIIKEVAGRLEVCYVMAPFYKETWELANIYGVVNYHLGAGTGLWRNLMGYIGADGVCRVVWDVFSDINAYWFFDLPEDFPYEIPEETWIVLNTISFGEYDRDPDYRDYDMLSLEKIHGGSSDDGQEDSEIDIDELSRAVMATSGKELYSFEEIRAMTEAREAELGLTEEIKNGPEVEWIPFTGMIGTF